MTNHIGQFASTALLISLAASGLLSCRAPVIGGDLARRAPHFWAGAPQAGLALELPYVPEAWVIEMVDDATLRARTRPGATYQEKRRMQVIPPMECRLWIEEKGSTLEQVIANPAPGELRYNERDVESPRASLFTSYDTSTRTDHRVGLVQMPSGRIAGGACRLLESATINRSAEDARGLLHERKSRTHAGSEAFAFYDQILLSLTDENARLAALSLRASAAPKPPSSPPAAPTPIEPPASPPPAVPTSSVAPAAPAPPPSEGGESRSSQ